MDRFLAGIIAALVRYNYLSWIFLGLSAAASFSPIPGLRGAFGCKGSSAGWLQAWNVCRAWDKGHPLLLAHEDLERLSNDILHRLSQPGAGAANFAATPTEATTDARANMALFGCILEAKHGAQGWARPSWSQFYAGLAAIHDQTTIFEPSTIQGFASGSEFGGRLRNLLVEEMTARGLPVPADQYLAAAADLATTWQRLRFKFGSVLKLIPWWARLVGGRLYWLDRSLSTLPMLQSEGMRPQLIKLLARWGTIPWAKTSVFVQPFAKKQGWLLLQERALRVFPEQKDVTFMDVGDVQLTRIACLEICQQVSNIARMRQSHEARIVDGAYPSKWDLFAAADFSLWDKASEEEERGQADNWDPARWQWRLRDGRAIKTS